MFRIAVIFLMAVALVISMAINQFLQDNIEELCKEQTCQTQEVFGFEIKRLKK